MVCFGFVTLVASTLSHADNYPLRGTIFEQELEPHTYNVAVSIL